MKEFKIKYSGSDAVVEFNDEPSAEVMMKIRKNAKRYTTVKNPKTGELERTSTPEYDIDEYITGLACNLITKAPWGARTDPDILRKLPDKTWLELYNKLGAEFPIQDFLWAWATAIYGPEVKQNAELQSTTDSTTNAGSEVSPKSG